jgi:hypothetical protein
VLAGKWKRQYSSKSPLLITAQGAVPGQHGDRLDRHPVLGCGIAPNAAGYTSPRPSLPTPGKAWSRFASGPPYSTRARPPNVVQVWTRLAAAATSTTRRRTRPR